MWLCYLDIIRLNGSKSSGFFSIFTVDTVEIPIQYNILNLNIVWFDSNLTEKKWAWKYLPIICINYANKCDIGIYKHINTINETSGNQNCINAIYVK